MAKLNVSYCIVCEDIRPETQGKYAILGFFGLLPHVNIKVKELGKPLSRLVFLANVEGDAGKYKLKFSVVGPDKKKALVDIQLGEFEINRDPTKRALIVVNVLGLIFEKEGVYTVRVAHTKKAFYESIFRVDQGPEELFTS